MGRRPDLHHQGQNDESIKVAVVGAIFLLHLLRSPVRSLGFTILGEIFAYVTGF